MHSLGIKLLDPIMYICKLLTCSISYLLYLILDLWNANKISISISKVKEENIIFGDDNLFSYKY